MAKKLNWTCPTDEQGRPIVDAYLRMSDGFDGKQDNRENQLADIMPLYEQNNWALGEVLQDEVSAWRRGVRRDDFETLLQRIETGVSAGAAFYNQDRFVRRPMDLERFLLLWEEGRDLKVGSAFGAINLNDGQQRAFMRQVAAMAMSASDDTSRRARRKAEGRRARGLLDESGGRAFGWSRPGADEGLVERERAALRSAFEEFVGGSTNCTQIAKKWNDAGLLPHTGNRWDNATVRNTMKRQRYAGRIAHGGEVVGLIADHTPIIDPTVFDQAMAIFESRRRGAPISGAYLGSGLIFCDECGRGMVSRPQYRNDGVAVPTYRCNKPKGCGRVNIQQAPVDEFLRKLVVQQLSDPAVAKSVNTYLRKASAEMEKVQRELDRAREAEVSVAGKFASGGLSEEAFSVALSELTRRIGALSTQLAEMEAAAADTAAVRARSKLSVEKEWDDGSTARRRKMLKTATGRLRVSVVRVGRQLAASTPAIERLKVTPL